jgi:hypothetical protein
MVDHSSSPLLFRSTHRLNPEVRIDFLMQVVEETSPMQDMNTFESERAVAGAKRLFQKTLSIWASELLELERISSRVPAWNTAMPLSESDGWSMAA